MYLPDQFQLCDHDLSMQVIENNGFGLLVSTVNHAPFASHIPMIVEEQGEDEDRQLILYGHVARANEHWQHFKGARALAIFQGPHAYVSPTWYENGGVPTWNYVAVHAYGHLSIIDDREQLKSVVINLSDQYENGRENPWVPDFPDSLLNGIVGFALHIDELQCKAKLSQHRSEGDRERVKNSLFESESIGDQKVARLMEAING